MRAAEFRTCEQDLEHDRLPRVVGIRFRERRDELRMVHEESRTGDLLAAVFPERVGEALFVLAFVGDPRVRSAFSSW